MVVAELLTRLGFEVDPRELNRGLAHAKSSLQGFKSFLGKLALGVGFYEIASHVAKTAAELETLNTQLHVMTGSTAKTQELFKGIVDYAKNTAFYVKDVTGSVAIMLQGMVNSSDVMPKIKQLGDIAADPKSLNSLAYAYAQANRQGFMSNYENRMFLKSGKFGVYQQYAMSEAVDQGKMTKGQEVQKGSELEAWLKNRQAELFGMAKNHEFSIGMLDKAIAYATTKGGIFFEHQKEQVKTLAGAWSNMWDVLNINAALAFQKLDPILKGLMKAITEIPMDWLVNGFDGLTKALEYIWAVMVTDGLLDAWKILKDTWKDFLASLPGGRDELWVLAKALSIAARAVLFLGVGFIRLLTLGSDVYKWLKDHKEIVIAIGAALGTFLLPKLLMSSQAMYELRFALLYLGEAFSGFLAGGFAGILGWFAKLGPLAMDAAKAIGIFMELWKVDSLFAIEMGVKSLGDGLVAMFTRVQVATPIWVAALSVLVWQLWRLKELGAEVSKQTAINGVNYAQADIYAVDAKIKQAQRTMASLPANDFQRTMLANQIAALNKERAEAVARKNQLATMTGGSNDSPESYLARLNADANKIAKSSDESLKKLVEGVNTVAGNTTPKGNVPNDVLRLAGMSFRTHFDVLANGIARAAE